MRCCHGSEGRQATSWPISFSRTKAEDRTIYPCCPRIGVGDRCGKRGPASHPGADLRGEGSESGDSRDLSTDLHRGRSRTSAPPRGFYRFFQSRAPQGRRNRPGIRTDPARCRRRSRPASQAISSSPPGILPAERTRYAASPRTRWPTTGAAGSPRRRRGIGFPAGVGGETGRAARRRDIPRGDNGCRCQGEADSPSLQRGRGR